MKQHCEAYPLRRAAALAAVTLSGAALLLAAGCTDHGNITTTTVTRGPSIGTFVANPANTSPNGTTTLSWATTAASGCTLAGAGPTQGKNYQNLGLPTTSQPPASPAQGVTTSALTDAGLYTFTLTCQGTDSSAPPAVSSTQVSVAPNGAIITPLTANPPSIQVGSASNTSILTWNHPEIPAGTTCTASETAPGGSPVTGAGAFTGQQPAVSPTGGFPVTLNTSTAGVYQFSLACGTETPDQTSVTIVSADVPLTATPNALVQGSGPVTLTWNHPNASSCTASETDPSGAAVTTTGAFTGQQTPADGNVTIAATQLNTVGNYTFSLACTTGTGTTATTKTDTATVNVLAQTSSADGNCDDQSNKLTLTNASAADQTFTAAQTTSGICLLCSVQNKDNAVDADLTNYASVTTFISLLGGPSSGAAETLTVTNTSMLGATPLPPYAAGKEAGFVVQTPNQVIGAGVLQSISVSTLLNGALSEGPQSIAASNGNGGALKVSLLGLTGSGSQYYAHFQTKKPFNAIQLRLAGLANVNNQIHVFYGCVADAPAAQTP